MKSCSAEDSEILTSVFGKVQTLSLGSSAFHSSLLCHDTGLVRELEFTELQQTLISHRLPCRLITLRESIPEEAVPGISLKNKYDIARMYHILELRTCSYVREENEVNEIQQFS